MPDFDAEISSFFDAYEKRWNSQNYASLEELWDTDDPRPFYRPMETDRCITNWEDLRRYWNPRPGKKVIDGLWNEYTTIVPKLVGPEVAVVFFDLEWNIKGPGRAKPMSGTDPGMAVLKKKPEGWRMVAYVEACMHPASYVRKLCERDVRPAFLDFLAERGAGVAAASRPDPIDRSW